MEESILDRLAAAIEEHQPSRRQSKVSNSTSVRLARHRRAATMRRPLLSGVSECSNVDQLLPFLHQVNSASFGGDATFTADKVDVKAVEADLRADMFRRGDEK